MYLVLEEKWRDIVFGFPWCRTVVEWCVVCCPRFLVGTFFLFGYLTLKDEAVQNAISISFLFPKAGDTNSLNLLVLNYCKHRQKAFHNFH